jgi:hypothetical protein
MSWDVKNPRDRAILQTARSWGVSPSRFMGEPKPQVAQPSPAGGFILSAPEEWTWDDRQAALDLWEYEGSLCSGCGHPLSETTTADKEFAYTADPPIRCHRCTASETAQEAFQDNPHPGALMIPIRLKEGVKNGKSDEAHS